MSRARFPRPGMQIMDGAPIHVRRGHPLPMKGRYRPQPSDREPLLDWFNSTSAHEGWLNAIWDNNPPDQGRPRMLSLDWLLTITRNNPQGGDFT